jgi:hypothetical protein
MCVPMPGRSEHPVNNIERKPHPLAPWLVLLACILAAGVFSVKAGKDYSWDLRNYHYYNAWAFLHGRLDIDVLPANIQGFINPLIELPFYALVSAGLSDYAVGFAMGIPAGIATWLVWLITGRLMGACEGWRRPQAMVFRALATACAVSGAAGSVQWGTSSGEWPVTCIVISALYLALSPADPVPRRGRYAVGPLLGIAVGLKLTALPFATAVALVYACREWADPSPGRARRLLVFVIGGIVATLAALAPWGIELWVRYRNPLFPYFNGVFKSDMVEKTNWRDARFLPTSAWEFFRLPWDLAFHREARYGDSILRDRRVLMGCVACIVVAATWAWSPRRRSRMAANLAWAPAGVFAVALVAWSLTTAIYRYAIGLEIVACLAVLAAVASLSERAGPAAWARLLVFLPILGTSVVSLGRSPFNGGAYFQETYPSIPAGSLVINYVPEDPPLAYLSPSFGTSVIVVKPMSNISRGHLNPWFQVRIHDIIQAHHGHVFLIAAKPWTKGMLLYLHGQGLAPDATVPCGTIRSQSFQLPDYVCELRRISP